MPARRRSRRSRSRPRSPSAQHPRRPGMPCTTSSLTEMHSAGTRVPVVAQERRVRRLAPRIAVLGDRVELGCGHPGRRGGRIACERPATTRPAARMSAPGQGSCTRSVRGRSRRAPRLRRRWRSARSPRSVTSSTSPMPSTPPACPARRSSRSGRGLLGVDVEPVPDRLGVVVALEQLAAAPVTDARPGGRRSNSTCQTCRTPGRYAGRRAAGRPPRRRPRAPPRGPGVPSSASIASSSATCAMVRGKPSSRKPSPASACASRSRTMSLVTSSGTSSPASMYLLAWTPSGVPLGDVGAEDVAGRDRRDTEVRGETWRLGALAGTGGPT